jgi:hypothetical protein
LGVRRKTYDLALQKFIVAKSSVVKTGWSNLAESSTEGSGSERAVLPMMMMMMMTP